MICDDALRQQIQNHLQQFQVRSNNDASLRRAAVALVVTDVGPGADLPGFVQTDHWSSEAALILTRRSAALRHHPGQWALPAGGSIPEKPILKPRSEKCMRRSV